MKRRKVTNQTWLWLTMSEAVVEASSRTTYQHWLIKACPKGTYPGYAAKRKIVITRTDTDIKQQPKITPHRTKERSNPLTDLCLDRASNQPDAPQQEDVPKKPKPGIMPRIY